MFSTEPRATSQSPLLIVGILLLVSTVAPAAPVAGIPAIARTELTGTTGAGATWRIALPDDWNGDLVVFANGIQSDNVTTEPPLGDLAEQQLAAGFAVATTSYRTNFYTLFKSRNDLKDLLRVFTEQAGRPARLFLVGISMGGLVTAEALERGLGEEIDGALIYCGLVGGAPYLDMYVDLRLAYDVECDRVAGGSIPGGAEGLPAEGLTFEDVLTRIVTCTGVDATHYDPRLTVTPTAAQKRRQKHLLKFSTIPNGEFLLEDLLVATFAVADTFFDPGKLRGRQGYTNIGVDYPDRRFDREIERVEADPRSRKRALRHYTPKGKIRDDARIVALHESLDGFNFVENLGEYAGKVPPDRLTAVVAETDSPEHCDFHAAELRAGWDELLAWVEGGSQPDAAQVQTTCKALAGSGEAAGPCRFAKDYPLGRLADRVPPR